MSTSQNNLPGSFLAPLGIVGNAIALFMGVVVAIAMLAGALSGLFLGLSMIVKLPTILLTNPIVGPAIIGVLAGCIMAWLTWAFALKEERSKPFVSALLSPEIWKMDAIGFAEHVAVNVIIGYLVAVAFAGIGVLSTSWTAPAPSFHEVLNVVMPGRGGGGGDDFFEGLFLFLIVLIALALAGALLGGILGSLTVPAFSSLDGILHLGRAIEGAAEGATYRILTSARERSDRIADYRYAVSQNAIHGALEGVLIGALSGALLSVSAVL